MLPDCRLVRCAACDAAKITRIASIVTNGANNILFVCYEALLHESRSLMRCRHLLSVRAVSHLLLLLLPQRGAQLPVLLKLSANRHGVHCMVVG